MRGRSHCLLSLNSSILDFTEVRQSFSPNLWSHLLILLWRLLVISWRNWFLNRVNYMTSERRGILSHIDTGWRSWRRFFLISWKMNEVPKYQEKLRLYWKVIKLLFCSFFGNHLNNSFFILSGLVVPNVFNCIVVYFLPLHWHHHLLIKLSLLIPNTVCLIRNLFKVSNCCWLLVVRPSDFLHWRMGSW